MTIAHEDDDGQARNRGSKRDSLFLLADVCREDGAPVGRVRIRNLSETGLMADCDKALVEGDRLIVHLRGVGEVPGRVSWTSADRIGVAFDSPIEPQHARKSVSSGSSELPSYLRPIISPKTGFGR